jgi:hypothetical protein
MNAGALLRGAPAIGNTLLISKGAWDTFEDVSEEWACAMRPATIANRPSAM